MASAFGALQGVPRQALLAGVVLLTGPLVLPARSIGQVLPPTPSVQDFPRVPQGSPIPRILPRQPPTVTPALPAAPQTGPEEVPAVSVVVHSVTVTGSTIYPSAELNAEVAGLAGQAIPLAEIEAARVALLERYRADGFALTSVTAVLDEKGALRLVVTEGYIAEVKLEGDIGPAGVQVLQFLDRLKDQRPIDTASLERWLLLANDVPGVTVQSVLRPSVTDPGALTLVAQVSRRPVSGLITADNRAFQLTGPQEGLAILDLNSFTQFGELTELSFYHTSGNTQNYGQGSSEFFVGSSGLKVRAYGGGGRSTPSDFLRSVGYEGFTTVFGASASYPVIRSRQQTLNALVLFDEIESEVRINTADLEQRRRRDDISVGRLGADYAIEDLMLRGDRTAVNTASVRLSQGLSFLGGSRSGDPLATRLNEHPDFTKFSAELVRTQTLFSSWSGATVAVKTLLAGQYSGDVLPPVEKFYLGGSQFTRGFYSGEATGDKAFAATIELQLNTSYDAAPFGRPLWINAQWYAFYDRGEAWQNQAIDPNFRLSSEGGGVRLNLTRYLEFDLEGVIRNTRLPVGTPGSVQMLKADAVYWRVLARF